MAQNCHQHNSCVEDALAKAKMICHDQNLSLTPIRQKVLKLVWEGGHGAVKAYDLLEKLQQDDASAKPVTVYRALDFLMEHRLIHKIESLNSFVGCNHPTRQHNCAFLICSSCHQVEECCTNEAVLDTVTSSIEAKQFQVDSITLEIHGTCQSCKP